MRRVDELFQQDRGQALVIALGMMAVLAATATTLFIHDHERADGQPW